VESAGSNPQADANGNLTIASGDHLPGVPSDQFKLGMDVKATDKLSLGATVIGRGPAYLFGDEANLNPKLPGYATLNLSGAYQLTPNLQIFARVENAANTTYYTYGAFSPTGSVYLAQAPSAANPRAYSPAAPIGGFGGVRLTF
jgi:outer membrane receptor protein involved in Fe transport